MCGIAGIVEFADARGRALDDGALVAMCEAMRLRGPDDMGTHAEPRVRFGQRRLSIIDLAGGHQPMSTTDGDLTITFNGEIYNYVALRERLIARGHTFVTSSDTEVILHAYRAWGDAAVAELDGMFAFALWDRAQKRLLLARDRFGKKPLYYCVREGAVWFASTLTALLAHPFTPRAIDRDAMAEYFALEYVVAPRTMLAGVQKLEPAHYLTFDERGRSDKSRYWDLRVDGRSTLNEHDAKAELDRLLDAAVKKRLVADVPLGVFLSGGVDSSLVTAYAARARAGIHTFSIRFNDPSYDESSHAREVAAHLGTTHSEAELTLAEAAQIVSQVGAILDEPIGDGSIVPTYLLSRFVRKDVTVALGGDGGDELFAGYPTYLAQRAASLLPTPLRHLAGAAKNLARHLPVSHDNFSFDFKLKKFLGGIARADDERNVAWLGAFQPEEVTALMGDEHDVYRAARERYARGQGTHLERVLYQDVGLYMCHSVLAKVDRASMAASLEVRAPLLDTAVAEFAGALPMSMKLRGAQTKYLLKAVARDYLPANIVDRPKKGFGMPTGRWLRAELQPLLRAMATDSRSLAAAGVIDKREVDRLIDEHVAGRADHRQRLWTLLVLELWRREHAIAA